MKRVKLPDLPPTSQTAYEEDERVEYASFGGKFNQHAHERDIKYCSSTKNKPTRLARGNGTGGGEKAIAATQ